MANHLLLQFIAHAQTHRTQHRIQITCPGLQGSIDQVLSLFDGRFYFQVIRDVAFRRENAAE